VETNILKIGGQRKMLPRQIVFALVTFLHNLFTVVWIGGMIVLAAAVLPSARQVLGMSPETKKLMDAIQKRLSKLVYVCIVGLLVTGFLLARRSPAFQGLFSFGNTYSAVLTIKHILTAAIIGVALYRSLALGGGAGPSLPAQEKRKMSLLLLNVVFGIVVLLLSGFSAALASPPPTPPAY
jgi:uncharacterized membrane protein